MKVGYIIVAHTLPDHLVRLVQRLRSDDARFFVHVDRRAPRAVMDVVERELGAATDVVILPRHRCQWGTFGQVEATLEGVRAVLEAPEKLEYAVLLTGQDYPLRPPSAIESTLEQADGRSFMSIWPATGRFLDRVRRWHWFGTVLGRRVRIPHRFLPLAVRRPLPGGLKPFTGTPHWCLARGCLEFIGDVMTHRLELVRSFRWTAHPDEAFFQTILMNSPLARTIVDDDLRYIDHPYGHASPRVLTSDDLGPLLESDALFARKFDPRVDSTVLEALDDHIDARAAAASGTVPRTRFRDFGHRYSEAPLSNGISTQPARIAVIIPCYRDGLLLGEAIHSIREAEPLELVVVDDASDDALTRAALEPLAAEDVTVIRNACNSGVGFSRNAGLRATSAPFVFPLDADDLAVPGMLGHMADALEQRPEAGVCFGDYLEFGDSNILRAVPDELDPYRLVYTNEYPVSALFRRTILEVVGGWPRTPAYEDWHLWMTLAERGETGMHAGAGLPTFRRRLHGARMLTAAKARHPTIYSQLRRDHPQLFEGIAAHRRRSRLSPIRKALYPLVYGGRRRRPWEPRAKKVLDRYGLWTLRR